LPSRSRRLGLSRNWTPVLSCAITAASNSRTSISKMSRGDARQPSCSARMRHGGLLRPSLNYRKRRIERIGEKRDLYASRHHLHHLGGAGSVGPTVPFLWEILKKINPDDVNSFRFFLTFVVVFVPLFILISFVGAAVIYDATASQLNMLHSGVVAAETPPCPN
jgi:hypothetical protein